MIKTRTAYTKLIPLSELKPNPENPRTIKQEKLDQLKKQILKLGWFKSFIIDDDNIILCGNMRYKVAMTIDPSMKVPCSVFEGTREERKIVVLSDNNDAGEWEPSLLEGFMDDLKIEMGEDFDIEFTGFDDDILADIGISFDVETQECEPDGDVDEIPEVSTEEPITKRGDIWELGVHRLMCGDSTMVDDVEKLIDGEAVDCLMTDPPYGVDYSAKNEFLNKVDKGNHIQKDIKNDAITDYRKWFSSFLSIIPFSDYNTFYIWMSGKELHNLRLAIEDCKYVWGDYLVWAKNNHVLGRKDYNAKHEFCVYGWKNHHKFYGDFSTTILEYNKPLKNDLHPTMKPVEMFQKLISDGSPKKGVILDLFGGSGTTLIACAQINRKARLMEIDEHYCDVIVKRYVKLYGDKAIKLNGKPYTAEE